MGKYQEITHEMRALQMQTTAFSKEQIQPSKIQSFLNFWDYIGSSVHFIFMEKENILFAVLQWMSIVAGYYLWVEIFSWIPREIWDTANEQHDWANLILLVWSFFCVGIVAYLLGIFTACICSSFLLRSQGQKSTVTECLKIALYHSGTLWLFSWIDGWWTVKRIVERLPSRNRPPLYVRLAREFAFQTWKISSLGFIPALLYGRSIKESAVDSFVMLKKHFVRLIQLRVGYSFACWIVGILCYVGSYYWIYKMGSHIDRTMIEYSIYWHLGVPILLALIVVMVLLRPLYIIAVCRVYAQYARNHNINAQFPQGHSLASVIIFALYLVLFGAMLYLFAFHKELGIDELMFKNFE